MVLLGSSVPCNMLVVQHYQHVAGWQRSMMQPDGAAGQQRAMQHAGSAEQPNAMCTKLPEGRGKGLAA